MKKENKEVKKEELERKIKVTQSIAWKLSTKAQDRTASQIRIVPGKMGTTMPNNPTSIKATARPNMRASNTTANFIPYFPC